MSEQKFTVWLRRIKNLIPKTSTIMHAISVQTARWISKVRGLVQSFSPYLPKTPFSTSMKEYPGSDTPLVIKIESYKNQRHFHGAAQYKDVFIDSGNDQNTTNQEDFIKPLAGKTAPMFFIMSPEKLGLNTSILKQAMQIEAEKKGDYDYYANNCIDHIIRPLKKAGAHIDFGYVSTPKELAKWCDQQCQKGNGILVDLETYKKILAAQKNNTESAKKNLKIDRNNQILNKLLNQEAGRSKKVVPTSSSQHSKETKTNPLTGIKKAKDNSK